MRYDRPSRQIYLDSIKEVEQAQKLAHLGAAIGVVDPEREGSLHINEGGDQSPRLDTVMTARLIGGLVMHARHEVSADDEVTSEREARHFLLNNDIGAAYGYGLPGSEEHRQYMVELYHASLLDDPRWQAEAEAHVSRLLDKQ